MGNSLRCCLACVLPCGALDLIRIVHLNGYIEDITRPVTAGDVLKNYPNHMAATDASTGDKAVRLHSSDVVVVSEKKKIGHRRACRPVQVGEWRLHLESIFEE
ncbi:hypothetical protein L1987_63991 [Smallanthus sonchifolius]|uniref:Uncharacterized protein n=1 Tax=Smallanthus sonchifolius TaxID=185202 RepID=A0ACB9CF47_9ASTR|nr:hypothetical protein L1987_63991 [Smallanthus sonchifolius]